MFNIFLQFVVEFLLSVFAVLVSIIGMFCLCVSILLMNKYKTINSHLLQQVLEDPIQNKINQNRINRQTIDFSSFDEATTQTDKNLLFIQLSKKHHQVLTNFKSSLYESSKKQFKQISNIFFLEDNKVSSSLDRKKGNDSLEEEIIRKIIKQKQQHKRQILPSVLQNSNQTSTASKRSFLNKSNQKLQGWQDYYFKKEREKHNVFSIDSTLIGFKNLKEKYLLLKQLDLKTNKKSELLERKLSKNKYFSQEQSDLYAQKIKINKKGLQNVNCENSISYLRQTKLSQINEASDIFFNDKIVLNRKLSHRKQDHKEDSPKRQHQISNFIHHRKMRCSAVQICADNKLPKAVPERYRQMVNQRQTLNPQKLQIKEQSCSPWQTDLIIID